MIEEEKLKTLRQHKHKQLEFFVADDIEISTFCDEIASMEHPFFALKDGDTKTRVYKNSNVTIEFRSSYEIDLATILIKIFGFIPSQNHKKLLTITHL